MLAFPDCPICIEPFDGSADVAACGCGHTFHYGCIVDWSNRCRQDCKPCLCPTCNKRFSISLTRGIVKKLYFTFDSGSKEQEDLKRRLDKSKAALKSKTAKNLELTKKLQLSNTLVTSFHEKNKALKQRTDVLTKIARWNLESAIDEARGVLQSPVRVREPNKSALYPAGGTTFRSCEHIWKTPAGKFQTSHYCHASFLKHIHGPKGKMRKRLQYETGTVIQILRPREEGKIIITGKTEDLVYNADLMIMQVVRKVRSKMPYTHFVSFPLNGPEVTKRLESLFRRSGLWPFSQRPERLNLTIGTLALLDETDVQVAQKALRYCRDEIIGPNMGGQLKVSLQGVYSIEKDFQPESVYAFCTRIEGESRSRLQQITDLMADHFSDVGLMPPSGNVSLEATIANTLFCGKSYEIDPPDRNFEYPLNERELIGRTVDVTKIVDKYDDRQFGECVISEVHISCRNTRGPDSYYLPLMKLDVGYGSDYECSSLSESQNSHDEDMMDIDS